MGQKIHPTGFRLSVNRNWSSKWFANSKHFAPTLKEDIKIREYLKKKLAHASVGKITIERPAKKARDVATESLALRVPGLLWVGWERIVGAGKWKPTGGQMRRAASDGGGVARCTQAQATRALRALGSGGGSA